MGQPKDDRRTRNTLAVIRQAFFELLGEVGFAKMTVSDICRRAGINRGTFYLHYADKFALLEALADEALDAEPFNEDGAIASMCQRVPSNEDHLKLYDDADAFPYVASRVIQRGAGQSIPAIMEKTGLSHDEANLVFVFMAQGNLAVNRLLGWRRNPDFERAQRLLRAFSQAGLAGIGQLACSDMQGVNGKPAACSASPDAEGADRMEVRP